MSRTAGPRIEERGQGVYFIDAAGIAWRVYDVAFGPPHCALGQRRGFKPPDPRANYRWFVSETGTERCVRLGPADRELTPERLTQQIAEAEYCPTGEFDPATRRPR